MSEAGISRTLRRVRRYYPRTESRVGYRFLLGGTKHFGWYEPGESPWRFAPAMRNEALATVCELAAMPAWARLNHGDLEELLEKAGFAEVSATDVTERMLPMLRAFARLGWFPYFLGRLWGRTAKVVNALSGVEMYRHRQAWRYHIYTAVKPGQRTGV